MRDDEVERRHAAAHDLAREVNSKAARKRRARESTGNVWFGLGMMGLVGWSVAVPTIAGATLGLWIDRRHPSTHSWTLALLVGGLVLGCTNAWYWIAKEDRAMARQRGERDG